MDKLELILYNVGHGLAVSLIERPENYVTQIDLGSEDGFSPLEYLLKSRKLRTDILYITHPHADHLSDIQNAYDRYMRPNNMFGVDYDWDDVLEREQDNQKWVIKQYRNLLENIPKGNYQGEASLWYIHWKPEYAKNTFGESTYINNSSLFLVYTWKTFKISIIGDIEKTALEKLLDDPNLQERAKNTDILVAPHHGHESGFTSKLVDVLGKPFITLVSVQDGDPSVAPDYSSPEFSKGVTFDGRTRYCLTTRTDGAILVTMYYDSENKAKWNFSRER
jgi:beta-lactamase superfamily II metal-dependent hydrolase